MTLSSNLCTPAYYMPPYLGSSPCLGSSLNTGSSCNESSSDVSSKTVHTGIYSYLAWKDLKSVCIDVYLKSEYGSLKVFQAIDNEICVNVYSSAVNTNVHDNSSIALILKDIARHWLNLRPESNVAKCASAFLMYGEQLAEKMFGKKMLDKVIGHPLNQMEIELKNCIDDELRTLSQNHEHKRKVLDHDKEAEFCSLRKKILKKHADKEKQLIRGFVNEKRKLKRKLMQSFGKSNTTKELINDRINLNEEVYNSLSSVNSSDMSVNNITYSESDYITYKDLNNNLNKIFTEISLGGVAAR